MKEEWEKEVCGKAETRKKNWQRMVKNTETDKVMEASTEKFWKLITQHWGKKSRK